MADTKPQPVKRPAHIGDHRVTMIAANADQPPSWPAGFTTDDGRRWVLDSATFGGGELVYREATP